MNQNKKPRSSADDIPTVISKPGGADLAQQQFKDEVDINNITNRYTRGTVLDPRSSNPRDPIWGDFTSVDFMDMQNRLVDARMAFDSLPARVRRRFADDPYQLIRFVENLENREEAEYLGLISKKPEEPTMLKADDEAQPKFKPPEGGNAP